MAADAGTREKRGWHRIEHAPLSTGGEFLRHQVQISAFKRVSAKVTAGLSLAAT